MAVYISKKAIEHNPLPTEDIDIQEKVFPELTSRLLSSIDYLNKLVRNDLNVKPLQEGNSDSTYTAVLALKVALQAIAHFEQDYDIPGTSLTPDGVYNQQMTSAIYVFQVFANVPQTGVIDSLTLIKIDAYLSKHKDAVIDTTNYQFIGVLQPTSIDIIQNVEGDDFIYNIIIDGEPIRYVTSEPLNVTPISNSNGDDFCLYCTFSEHVKDEIAQQNNFSLDQNIEFGQFKYTDFRIPADPDLILDEATFQSQIDIIPPQNLDAEDAFLYKVKPGDNLIDLITSNYYNGTEDIINPHDNSVIFTLPSRVVSPIANRNEDARLQFYLNLIYYINIKEEETSVTEYGIKAAQNYKRYDDDLLEEFYMFNNTFDVQKPQSVLPNYKSFLDYMEQQTNNPTKIEFDANGQPTSFQLEVGKYIWIPSRKFVEGFYFHLNFRYSEMLNETADGYEYVSPAELSDTIDQMQGTSFWGTLSSWLQSQIETLYTETVSFYTSMYGYAINTLTNVIPRGVGIYLDSSVGVTYKSIAGDLSTAKTFWRKMTPINELTFVLREESEVYLGLQFAVGKSAGFKIGSGKKGKKIGVNVGAGFDVGVGPRVTMEYEFPIRPEETALISFLLTFTKKARLVSKALDAFNVINISPTNYLTWMQTKLPVTAKVWGAAQVGIKEDGDPSEDETDSITAEVVNDPAQEAKNNSFINIDSILNKVKTIGIQGTAQVSLGIEMNYFAQYDDKPLIPEKDGRVPSQVKLQALYFAHSKIGVGGIGSMLGSLFVNVAGGISGIFGAINFDKGVAIGLDFVYTRTVTARNLTYNDTVLNENTLQSQPNKPSLEYNGGNWKTTLFFGSFTGDTDMLCAPGTEAMVKLNAGKIYQILQGLAGNDYSFANLDDIIAIFHSFSYQYKMGLGFNTHQRKTLDTEVFDSLTSGQMAVGVTKDFLSAAKRGKPGFDLYAGVDVSMELLIEDIAEALKYHMRRVYIELMIFADLGPGAARAFKERMKLEKNQIFNSLSPTGNSILDADCYPILYGELNDFLVNSYGTYLQTPNFKDVFKLYIQLYKLFNIYLFKSKSPELDDNDSPLVMDVSAITEDDNLQNVDLGTTDLLNVLALTAQVLNANAALEAKVGLSLAVDFRAGVMVAYRLSASGAGGIIGQMKFMEDGEFIEILPGDPYEKPLHTIKKLLDTSMGNGSKRVEGLRRSLTALPKE